jgi:hypothetical protein
MRESAIEEEVRALIERVRATRSHPLVAMFEQRRTPGPQESFPELVDRCEAETIALWETGGERVQTHRSWSRGMLGAAPDDQVDALARRRDTTVRINAAMIDRLQECADAAVTGDGAELLSRSEGPLIIAAAHSVPTAVTWLRVVTLVPRETFWPVELPDSPPAGPESLSPFEALAGFGVGAGARLIGRERRFDIYRELLDQGEACVLPVNTPGHAKVRFFGQDRWCSSGHAALAFATAAPVVVATAFLGDRRFELRLSRAMTADQFGSVEEMEQAIMSTVEQQLEGDPARLVSAPPSVDPDTWSQIESELSKADEDAAASRRALEQARTRFEEASRSFKAAAARRGEQVSALRAAKQLADEANAKYRDARELVEQATAETERERAVLDAARSGVEDARGRHQQAWNAVGPAHRRKVSGGGD